MIEVFTAHTLEMDEPRDAVTEILEQLDLDHNLRKYSAGIVNCYSGFVESGVVRALCAALPFPVVGGTSLSTSTDKSSEMPMLNICMLTSDDVQFAPMLTAPLGELSDQEINECIRSAYREAASTLPAAPVLNLVYVPLITRICGESLVETLDAVSEGVPLYGTTVCDHHLDFHEAITIFQGESYTDSLVMLLLSGPVDPHFFVITISDENMQKQPAIVTDSEGQLLKTVNHMTALEYLQSMGLTENGHMEGSVAIPFLVDLQDGTPPVARAMFTITDEGYAACGGFMPVGSTLAIGSMDYTDVMSSIDQILPAIRHSPSQNGMLMISCLTRSIALEMNSAAESEKMEQKLAGSLPFQLCYSAGEICPVMDTTGKLVNRYHNFTLTACVF